MTENYEVIPASCFEWGLLYKGKGVRTWYGSDFPEGKPTLEHPLIQDAIRINEEIVKEGYYDKL